jgi:hypothetical protein
MRWDDWSLLTLHQKVSWLDRAEITQMLESVSIQCYDSEDTEVLRDALLTNVLDGTIDRSVIESAR